MGEGFELVELFVPAGGADDDAAAECEHGAHVFDCGGGVGEVDDHIDAGDKRAGDGGGAAVFSQIEDAHAVAALAGDFRYQSAGFSFAEDEEKQCGQLLAVSFQLEIVTEYCIAFPLRSRPRGNADPSTRPSATADDLAQDDSIRGGARKS